MRVFIGICIVAIGLNFMFDNMIDGATTENLRGTLEIVKIHQKLLKKQDEQIELLAEMYYQIAQVAIAAQIKCGLIDEENYYGI